MKTREEKRKAFINQNQPEWKATGRMFKKARLEAGLTLKAIADYSGFSSSKISAFEHGEPMYSRKAVEMAFVNAIRMRVQEAKEALNRISR